MAIIDSGFDLDPTTGEALNGNTDYRFPLQADVVDHDLKAGGPDVDCSSPPNCSWYGQQTFGVAAAAANNLFGWAGTGGQVVRPMIIRVDHTWLTLAAGIQTAVLNGASVVSISLGGECGFWCSSFGGFSGSADLQGALGFASWNVVTIVSAGNTGSDVGDTIPCRFVDVICVGAIDQNKLATSYSNFGRSVGIWAPSGILTTPTRQSIAVDADNLGVDELPVFNGTSASAPFVAGIAGLMKALDPSIDYIRARQIFQRTANVSPDAKVSPGYVDAFRAVAQVKRPEPLVLTITSPLNQSTASWAAVPSFNVEIADRNVGSVPEDISVTWTSNRDGLLCSGRTCIPSRDEPWFAYSHRNSVDAVR